MGRIQLGLPVILLLGATAVYSDEQVDGVDDEPRRCINTGSILRTRIIDDSNIVFIMRGDKMYLNTLRKPCSGLARGGSFYYATPTRSLCEMQRIGYADYMTTDRKYKPLFWTIRRAPGGQNPSQRCLVALPNPPKVARRAF